MRTGGVANRPGTMLDAEVKTSILTVRLLKFVFINGAVNNTYLFEFGDHYIRFHQHGAPVITTGVGAWVTATAYTAGDLVTQGGVTYYCTTAHTSSAAGAVGNQPGIGDAWQTVWYAEPGNVYEIPSPYAFSELPDLDYVQNKDVVTLVHPLYAVRELKRFGHTRWTFTTVVFGPAIGTPLSLTLGGGNAGALTYWAVTATDAITNEESLPGIVSATNRVPSAGTPTIVSWALVAGADSYNIYRGTDGVTFGFIGTTGGVPLLGTDTSWTTASDTVTTSTMGAWIASVGQARNPVVAAATDKATDSNYHLYARVSIIAASLGGTPSVTLGRLRAFYARDAETRVDAGIIYGPATLSGVGTSGPTAFDAVITVPDNGYTTLTIDIVPEVFGTGSGLNQYQCTIDASVGPNNRIDWRKGGSSFSDVNTAPNFAEGPPSQPMMFSSPGNYPSTVGYYQQRQLFGNTTNDPERSWASRSASFKSFATSTPLEDDDALSWRMAAQHLNAIKHFIDLYGRLLTFASESEWTIEGDQAGTLIPTAINPRQQSGAGIGRLWPLIVIKSIVFVQARGSIVRDFAKAIQDFDNSDLTIFASHLVDGYTLVDWDYQQNPHSVIWGVRNDGVLLGLTYVPGQDVWGWHRHDTDGFVENVCVIPEGNEDVVYLAVRRIINGVTKRYIERMVSRQIVPSTDVRDLVFMDCAVTVDGRNTTAETMTLSGGTTWDETETLTITRSIGGFSTGEIGNAIFFTDASGEQLRFNLTGFTSGTVMSGQAVRTVPVELRVITTAVWSRAVDQVTGLSHLEGKAVSIFADGFVIASPNNSKYAVRTVTAGVVDLDQPRAVIHVGLPYLSDLETLDIDTASGPSLKERFMNVGRVGIFLQKSRPFFAGREAPSGTDPLEGLQELKLRETEDYNDPITLVTSDEIINIDQHWDSHGRVFLRQVDPVPTTILSVTPMGKL